MPAFTTRILQARPIVSAQLTCVCMGVALLIWSVGPAVIERAVTGRAPSAVLLAAGAIGLLLGITYIGLFLLLRTERRWATWAAFVLSFAIAAAWFIGSATVPGMTFATYLVLFAGANMATCGLALASPSRPAPSGARAPAQGPTPRNPRG